MPDDELLERVRELRVRELRARGRSPKEIARALKVTSPRRSGPGETKRARAAFLSLRTAHVIAACHMTALEICYTARNQADLEALLGAQRALEWLPVNEAVMDRALEVQRLLAAHSGNGHRRPIPAPCDPRREPHRGCAPSGSELGWPVGCRS